MGRVKRGQKVYQRKYEESIADWSENVMIYAIAIIGLIFLFIIGVTLFFED